MDMERELYSERELMAEIEKIERECDIEKEYDVDISLEGRTEERVILYMYDISEHCIIEKDVYMDMYVYEWKVISKGILIVVDFENEKLIMKCIVGGIEKDTEMENIVNSLGFLHPKERNNKR